MLLPGALLLRSAPQPLAYVLAQAAWQIVKAVGQRAVQVAYHTAPGGDKALGMRHQQASGVRQQTRGIDEREASGIRGEGPGIRRPGQHNAHHYKHTCQQVCVVTTVVAKGGRVAGCSPHLRQAWKDRYAGMS